MLKVPGNSLIAYIFLRKYVAFKHLKIINRLLLDNPCFEVVYLRPCKPKPYKRAFFKLKDTTNYGNETFELQL